MVEIIWGGRIFSFGGAYVNFLYTLMDIRKILWGRSHLFCGGWSQMAPPLVSGVCSVTMVGGGGGGGGGISRSVVILVQKE